MGKKSETSDLDRELAAIAGGDGDVADLPMSAPAAGPLEVGGLAVPEPARSRATPAPRGNLGLLAMLFVMVGGVVTLFMFGFKDAAIYSIPVDKLLASGETGRRVRIDGELVPGTLSRRDKPCEYRFSITGAGKVLELRYPQCVVPDTFRDVPQGGVMVTAEGKLDEAGHFEASLILAKCSSKYDPKTHSMEVDGGAMGANGSMGTDGKAAPRDVPPAPVE